MAPCVAIIDEVEKAFAGVNGSGDSRVSSRMFGTFLLWLNDHESDVFVVCTANDVSRLPPEFGHSEWFDGIFFLDLPGRPEKDAIWRIYREQFEISSDHRQPDDTNWTGAEIRVEASVDGELLGEVDSLARTAFLGRADQLSLGPIDVLPVRHVTGGFDEHGILTFRIDKTAV